MGVLVRGFWDRIYMRGFREDEIEEEEDDILIVLTRFPESHTDSEKELKNEI